MKTQTPIANPNACAGLAGPTGYGQVRDNLSLAKWLESNHDDMRRLYFDDWVEIVAEQKPLIEGLMKKANTDNPLSAVLPVCETIPVGDISRLLLLAVATEMITRGHNAEVSGAGATASNDNNKSETRQRSLN